MCKAWQSVEKVGEREGRSQRLQLGYLVSYDNKQQGDSLGENQPNYQLCPHYLDLIEWCNYNDFLPNLHLEVFSEGPKSQRKSKSPQRDGKKRVSALSKEVCGIYGGQESLEAKSLAGDTTNGDILLQIRGNTPSSPLSIAHSLCSIQFFSKSVTLWEFRKDKMSDFS